MEETYFFEAASAVGPKISEPNGDGSNWPDGAICDLINQARTVLPSGQFPEWFKEFGKLLMEL